MPTAESSKTSEKNGNRQAKPKKPVSSINTKMPYKTKRIESWSTYIYKVLREIYQGNIGISRKAMVTMNQFIDDMFEKFVMEISRLIKRYKKKTIDKNDIEAAVRLMLPGELATHAVAEGKKAIHKYNKSVLRD